MSENRENTESGVSSSGSPVKKSLLDEIFENTPKGELVRRFLKNNYAGESVGFLLANAELNATREQMIVEKRPEKEVIEYEAVKSAEIYEQYLHQQPKKKGGTGIGDDMDPLSSKELVNLNGETFAALIKNKLGNLVPSEISKEAIQARYKDDALAEKHELFKTADKEVRSMLEGDILKRFSSDVDVPVTDMVRFLDMLNRPKGPLTLNIPSLLSATDISEFRDKLEQFKKNLSTMDDLHTYLVKINEKIEKNLKIASHKKAEKVLGTNAPKASDIKEVLEFYKGFLANIEKLEKNLRKTPEALELTAKPSR